VWEVPRLSLRVEGQRRWRRNWVHAADEHPGVSEGDMPTGTLALFNSHTARRNPSCYDCIGIWAAMTTGISQGW
jgi:hypothetical protein